MQSVNEFKDLSLTYSQTGGTAALVFRTDLSGNVMADRKTVTLAATSGRQTISIPLDGIRGKQFQLRITPGGSTATELYSGVVRFRPIGEYIDGASGEIWETQPIALGA